MLRYNFAVHKFLHLSAWRFKCIHWHCCKCSSDRSFSFPCIDCLV